MVKSNNLVIILLGIMLPFSANAAKKLSDDELAKAVTCQAKFSESRLAPTLRSIGKLEPNGYYYIISPKLQVNGIAIGAIGYVDEEGDTPTLFSYTDSPVSQIIDALQLKKTEKLVQSKSDPSRRSVQRKSTRTVIADDNDNLFKSKRVIECY